MRTPPLEGGYPTLESGNGGLPGRAVQSPRDAAVHLSRSSAGPARGRLQKRTVDVQSAADRRLPAQARVPRNDRSGEARARRGTCGLRRAGCVSSRQRRPHRLRRQRRRRRRHPARLPEIRAEEGAAAHRRRDALAEERSPALDGHAAAGRDGQGLRLPQGLKLESASMAEIGTMRVKSGLAEMLKGGVIMDVTTADQARIAEDAGAVAVMALERVPADIRAEGGVARMADPDRIREIQEAVTIPVMAKCRIGHFVEAQILEALEVDYIDESEVLTPADEEHHVDKWRFTVPFVCGATNLGEGPRRIAEGGAIIRAKGEAGTGGIVNAVTHMRSVFGHIRRLGALRDEELYAEAKELRAPHELVKWVAQHGRLPVVTFTAGGIATPADAALCMQLGADGVFVGSGIFKSSDPSTRAKAIVEATTHFQDADILARVSSGLGDAMSGLSAASLRPEELLETRGW